MRAAPIRALVLVVASVTAWPRPSAAQAGRADLTGEIRDEAGALVPECRVTVTELTTRQAVTVTTGPAGVFNVPYLRPGSYRIAAEAAGFRPSVRDGVQLATGERVRVDFRLAIGPFTEATTVTADAAVLQTESSSLGEVVANRSVVQLPLNGRSYLPLVALVPGVAFPPGAAFPRLNGGRPRVNEYLYDGISVLQPEPGTVPYFPVIDAIQEFKVVTNVPPAEFGRFNGGVVNLSTKGGGNAFHGAAFEFLRNEALNARNLFAPSTPDNPDKPVFRRNQFGFVLGGPIAKDQTFFFVDYQGSRQSIDRVRISTVPTALQRQGVFTEPVAGQVPTIFDPATSRPASGGGTTRDPFPENTIPAARIDAVAATLLGRYPLPNLPGTANNYRRVGNESDDQDQFDIRLDHRASAKDQLFARFSYFRDLTVPVTPLPDGSGNLTTGAIGRTDTSAQAAVLSYVHTFGSRVVNDLRLGYTRRPVSRLGLLLDGAPSDALGLPGIPTNAAYANALPTFTIDGFQQLGSPANTNSDSRTDVTQLVDTISWQRGRHSLKAGLDYRYERLDIVQPPSPTGLFRFTSLGSDLPGKGGTGSSLASFLLGQVQSFSIDLQHQEFRERANVLESFIQDDWRATSRLTINAGLRYTLNFPSTEVHDQSAVFNLATQKLEYAGQDGTPRAARTLHWGDLGPRLGFALQLGPTTVVRSGYALVWIEQAGITTPFTQPQFPFLQNVSQRSLDNIRPAFVLSQGPSVAPIELTPDAGLGQSVYGVTRDLGSGYSQQWNLAVQRELGRDLAVEIAYAGAKGTHIGVPDTNLNQLTVDQLALGNALLQRVPNPCFGAVPPSSSIGGATVPRAQVLRPYPCFNTVSLYRNNVGNTSYNALQVKAEKRLSHGVSFLVSYTWSKLIDTASSVFDASILAGPVANFPVADSYNPALERDVSTGDIPHNLVASFVWDLPWGKGRRFEPSGVAGALLSGWQLAGIATFQSGVPIAITQVTNFNAFAGFGTQRPNRVADPNLPSSEQSTARWFNTDAFQVAPQFTLGDSSRNPVRGPGCRNVDLALIKRTPIGGSRATLELRVEAFNLTNTPPLGAPNGVLGAPGFGSITSAGDPRVIQVGVKLVF
ncbi:MAG TPA: carboxypeptidase regulatory-like domain-containing protein [Vicinamibacteria bacterium]|nr:carboxypeptidase regulatory-like domain-containing protein [Vicinamibacteria bacterium]